MNSDRGYKVFRFWPGSIECDLKGIRKKVMGNRLG